MGKRVDLAITAEVKPGDYGRDYVLITIGDLEVTVYESQLRPGGITIEIDGDDAVIGKTVININDWRIFPVKGE